VLRDATRPVSPSAAEAFLGEAEGPLVAAVTHRWQAAVGELWRHGHEEARTAKAELQRLDELAANGTLEPGDALTRAHLTTAFRGQDAGLERYRELVGTENDAPGRFGVGKLLLARGEEEGLRWLDEAIDRDPDAVLPACELAYEWLRDRGRDDEAQLYRSRGARQADELEAADEERSEVSIEDELAPPALPDELVERIRRKVAWHEEVREAYVVRKVTEHLDEEHPFHVVALVPKSDFRTAWREADDDEEPLEARVARDLALSDDFMVAKVGRKSPLAQRFAEIDGAKVFSRD
jgi:hypothetical protein